jgi:hypothetical protein
VNCSTCTGQMCPKCLLKSSWPKSIRSILPTPGVAPILGEQRIAGKPAIK